MKKTYFLSVSVLIGQHVFCMEKVKPVARILLDGADSLSNCIQQEYMADSHPKALSLEDFQAWGVTFEMVPLRDDSDLQALNLDHKYLSDIARMAHLNVITKGSLVALKELNNVIILLGSNQLTDASGLATLCNLRVLDLSKNRLGTFFTTSFRFHTLRVLDISFNRLTYLPAALANLINLEELNVSNNQLLELPDGIGNLTALEIFDVSNNKLRRLDPRLCNLKYLKAFNIMHNPFGAGNAASLPMIMYKLVGVVSLQDKKCFARFFANKSYAKATMEWYQWGKKAIQAGVSPYNVGWYSYTVADLYAWLKALLSCDGLFYGNPLERYVLPPEVKKLIFSHIGNFDLAQRFMSCADIPESPLKGPLCRAAEDGGLETVGVLLNTDVSDADKGEALFGATKNRHRSLIQALLKAGVTSARQREAVLLCAVNGDLELFEIFLSHNLGDREKALVLSHAINKGHIEVALAVMRSGLGGKARAYALKQVAAYGHSELVEGLIKDVPHEELAQALYSAAKHGHANVVEKLTTAFKDKGATGLALFLAAKAGHVAVIRILLQCGVTNKDRYRALCAALSSKHLNAAEMLWNYVDTGSEKSVELKMSTALRICERGVQASERGLLLRAYANAGHVMGVLMVLAAGVDKQDIGYALVDAAAYRYREIVALLLPKVSCNDLIKIAYFAELNGHAAVLETLDNAGLREIIRFDLAGGNADIMSMVIQRNA